MPNHVGRGRPSLLAWTGEREERERERARERERRERGERERDRETASVDWHACEDTTP